MPEITYTSSLGTDYRDEVESLLFLNPDQHRVREAIVRVVEQFGVPLLVEENGRLRVRVKSGQEVQALFAVVPTPRKPRVGGVLVYTRSDLATLLVLHLAVTPDYSYHGRHHRDTVALQLVGKLREIGSRVKGVQTVRLLYGRGEARDLPVRGQ